METHFLMYGDTNRTTNGMETHLIQKKHNNSNFNYWNFDYDPLHPTQKKGEKW